MFRPVGRFCYKTSLPTVNFLEHLVAKVTMRKLVAGDQPKVVETAMDILARRSLKAVKKTRTSSSPKIPCRTSWSYTLAPLLLKNFLCHLKHLAERLSCTPHPT